MAEASENQKDKSIKEGTQTETTVSLNDESVTDTATDKKNQPEEDNNPTETAVPTNIESASMEDETQEEKVPYFSEEAKSDGSEAEDSDANKIEEVESLASTPESDESVSTVESEPSEEQAEIITNQEEDLTEIEEEKEVVTETQETAEESQPKQISAELEEDVPAGSQVEESDASEPETLTLESVESVTAGEKDSSDEKVETTPDPELISADKQETETVSKTGETEVANEETQPEQTSAKPEEEDDTKEGNDDNEEQELPDYSQFSREELAREIEGLAKGDEVGAITDQVRELKVHFDELEAAERQQALDKYVKGGGEAEGFEYRPDEFYTLFYAAYDKIRERRSQHRAEREKTRQENLKAKEEILSKLRDFVDSEETQVSISKLKELQQEWRSIGEVPSAQNRTLWANYHALLDRFYDNRSIYFELKELDRKKNLASKVTVAERAEQLVEEPDIKKATKELDELHEEYKHIGPVPRDEQEALWQRFKAASDKIHDRRREDVESFKEQLNKNLEEKLKLVEEVKEFTGFNSESIKEWNKKTKDIQQLQKRWEAAGSMPRSQAKEVNRQFWSSFKEFFAHKGEFFQRLDAQREENLKKKEALAEKAESLKDSEDWKSTSNELKRLQREWKEVGPVPERARESVYQRFKAACDAFFERRRNNSQEAEVEYQKNLKVREEICEKIENLAKERSNDLDALTELIQQYSETGFVPRSAMKTIGDRYQQAVNQFVENAEDLDENQKKEVLVEIELGTLKGSPGGQRRINQKEGSIRRQISRLEDDIALWKNNISFFTSSSKQANKLIADVEQKIEKATAEVEQLKLQLDIVRNLK
ncbi:MAG: DUF349 domain-containing protein [Bacteroidota bacterium]